MKSDPPVKKTLKLKVNDAISFRLVGISSHENDYRLVWAINNQLRMGFIRAENLVVHHAKLNTELAFSRFLYADEDRIHNYTLISNRCPDGFLFPEIRNFDFIIQVSGNMTEAEENEFIKKLKTVEVISASFALKTEKLKDLKVILPE